MTDEPPRPGLLPSRRFLQGTGRPLCGGGAADRAGIERHGRTGPPGPHAAHPEPEREPFDPGPICRPAAAEGPAGPLKPIKLAWNATAICTAAAPLAKERGIFAAHGLDVEFVNFGGSTEALLEAITTGKPCRPAVIFTSKPCSSGLSQRNAMPMPASALPVAMASNRAST
jgi:NitT/TauT family transport system substrate-binding protein